MARLAKIIGFGPIVLLTLSACSGGETPAPDMTLQQFMALEVQPTADIFWRAVGSVSELIENEPVYREYQPETDEAWAEVAAAAVKLREHGELLATPAYSAGRDDDWLVFAQGLQDAAVLAEQATLGRNREAMLEVGGTIYNVCAACHMVYPTAELPYGMSEPENRPMQDQAVEVPQAQ